MNQFQADILKRAAESQNLSPLLLQSIVSVESSFLPDVISGKTKGLKGELGAFQFMPQTAKDMGVDDPLNFEEAAFGAARLLRQNIDYFQGDEDKGITAYNTGLKNVDSAAGREYLSKIRKIYQRQNVAQFRDVQQRIAPDYQASDETLNYEAPENLFEDDDTPTVSQQIATPVSKPTDDLLNYEAPESLFDDTLTRAIPDYSNITKDTTAKDDPLLTNTDPREISPLDSFDARVPAVNLTELEEADLFKDENINKILRYFEGRFGKDYVRKELDVINKDGTLNKQELVDEFKNEMRFVEFNQTFGGTNELTFLSNITNKEDLLKVVEGHELYDRLPTFFDKIGDGDYMGAAENFGGALKHMAYDPLNLIGFGIGAYVKHTVAREGIKTLLKQKLKQFRIDKKLKPSEKITRDQYKDVKKQTYEALGVDIKTNKLKFLSPARLKAMKIGAGVEFVGGVAVSLQSQRVENEINRKRVELDTFDMIENRGVSPSVAKAIEKKRLEGIEIDPKLLLVNGLLTGIAGGLSASFVAKDVVTFRTSQEIYSSSLRSKRLGLVQDNPEIEKLLESFQGFLTEEFGNTKLDFGKVDFSKIAGQIDTSVAKGFKDIGSFIDYVKKEGRITLNELQDAGILTKAQIKNDLIKRALTVGYEIIIRNPQLRNEILGYGPKAAKVKISDAITNVLTKLADDQPSYIMGTRQFDENILRGALEKAGITAQDFVYATRTTVSDAGKTLNAFGQILKGIKNLRNLDPDMQIALDNHFATNMFHEYGAKPHGTIFDLIRRIERESKAFVVAGLGTTVRNVFGTSVNMTFETAARAIDFILYNSIRVLDSAIFGKYKHPSKKLTEVIEDEKGIKFEPTTMNVPKLIETEFGVLGHMMMNSFDLNKVKNIKSPQDVLNIFAPIKGQVKISDQLDLATASDPYLRQLIRTSLQESGTQTLSRGARFINGLNIIQDSFLRSNTFTHSIKRQLKRQGLDFETMVAKGMKIDPDVLKNAADEALEMTFAKRPEPVGDIQKRGTGIFDSAEKFGTNVASGFVGFFENFPGASLAVTFPRFMVNAMQWQYKYNAIPLPSPVDLMAGSVTGINVQTLKSFDLAYEAFYKSFKVKKEIMKKLDLVDDLKAQLNSGKISKDKYGQLLQSNKLEGFASEKGRDAILRQHEIRRDRTIQEMSLAMSRGIVGGAAVSAAFEYRLENQDIAFHEIRLPGGGTMTMLPVFPLAPLLAVGDYLAKMHLGRSEETPIKELGEALAGIKLSPVPLVQGLTDFSTWAVDYSRGVATTNIHEEIDKFTGRLLGDFANRFQQFVQPLYGLVDSIHKENTIVRDTQQLESDQNVFLETAFNTILGRTSALLTEGVASAYESLATEPMKEWMKEHAPYLKTKNDLPERVRFFDPGASIRGNDLFDAFKGSRIEPRAGKVEQEFNRLNLNAFRVFGSTGDRKFDAAVRREALEYFVGDQKGLIEDLITPGTSLHEQVGYSKMSRVQQKRTLLFYTRAAIQQATELALQKDMYNSPETRNRLAKRWFNRLPSYDRRLVADLYEPTTPGKTIFNDYANTSRYEDAWKLYPKIEIPDEELGNFSDAVDYNLYGLDRTREALE